MRRIETFDIERRVGLCKTFGLSLCKSFGEGDPRFGDPGQDVVAGAVQNADHAVDPVADKRLPDRFDDGHASAHTRLVAEFNLSVGERPGNGITVAGDERLVGGHHMLAVFDGF